MMELKLRPRTKSLIIHAVNDFTASTASSDFMYKGFYESGLNIKISHGARRLKVSKQGIYYYNNLEAGNYTVTLKSPLFVTEKKSVSIVAGVLSEITVRMKPGYDYRFYGETAFMRGTVIDSLNSRPLDGIRVQALPRTEEAFSDENGRFMIYFKVPILAAGEQISLTFLQSSMYKSATVKVPMVPMKKTTLDAVKLVKR